MKILKGIILTVVILVVAVLVFAAFLPSAYTVKRSVMINADRAAIEVLITDLHQWDQWSPWKDQDSAAVYKYSNNTGMGAWMEWNGKIVGAGKLTLTGTDTAVTYELQFTDPWESLSEGSFCFTENESGTEVTWTDKGELPWPMGRLMGFFNDFDKMMGPDFEKGLARLKDAAENSHTYLYEVKEKEIAPMTIATIRSKITMDQIPQTLGKNYGDIIAFIEKNGAKMAGYPTAMTIAYDSTSWDFEAAIPIDKEIKGNDLITVKKAWSGKVIYVEHKGSYSETFPAYTDLEFYMKDKGYEEAAGPWEVYVTDPATEPDTSKWITEIYFLIKE